MAGGGKALITPGFFFALGFALLVFVGYYVVQGWMEENRADAYQQYYAKHGFHFEAKRPGAENRYAAVVTIFTRGYNRWRDRISGQFDGSPFTAFEYAYTVPGAPGATDGPSERLDQDGDKEMGQGPARAWGNGAVSVPSRPLA